MRTVALAALLSIAAAASPARAGMCALDNVPGATLLLPYFEVDFLGPQGAGPDTLVRVHNATDEPALVHLTMWTEWAQPSIDFDFYLTGYDVAAFSLRDFFTHGNIPITADEQSDPDDGISPDGGFGAWDGSFPGCSEFFPFFHNPMILGANLERLRDGHSGQPVSSIANRCLGPDHGDNRARGYITFDTVKRCSVAFPFDPGYFTTVGSGIAAEVNRLFGDWQVVDPGRGIVFGGPLAASEADPAFGPEDAPTGYTFWGTFSGGDDHREPLGAVWDFRYAAGAAAGDPFTATELLVWRDTTSSDFPSSGFACGLGPTWLPLDEGSVICFDEQENALELCQGADERCFPLATQKVAFGRGPLAVPYARGFCRVDLDNPNDAPAGDVDFPAAGPTVQQGLLSVLRTGANGTGASLPGALFRHACDLP